MSNDLHTEAVKRVWLDQPSDVSNISLDDLKRGSRKFQRGIGIRNLVEYAAAVFVVVMFSQEVMTSEKVLFRIGCLLIVIATLYVVVQIHVRLSSQKPPPDEVGISFVDFHRASLLRQADGLESMMYWYMLPFLPGWSLFILQAMRERQWGAVAFFVGAALVIGYGGIALNRWFARRLRRSLAEFDSLVAGSDRDREVA